MKLRINYRFTYVLGKDAREDAAKAALGCCAVPVAYMQTAEGLSTHPGAEPSVKFQGNARKPSALC